MNASKTYFRGLIFFATVFSLLLSETLMAQNSRVGCQISPSELNAKATAMVKHYHDLKQNVPNSVRASMSLHSSSASNTDVSYTVYTYEGFLRPLKDNEWAIPQFPLLSVDITRATEMVYVCINQSTVPTENHITFYFLSGGGLDASDDGGIFGSGLFSDGPSLKVTPVIAHVTGVQEVPKLVRDLFGPIPVLNVFGNLGVDEIVNIETAVRLGLSEIPKDGVERVEISKNPITSQYNIELDYGVDLNHPDDPARVSKTISLSSQR